MVLSQFSKETAEQRTLADYFPKIAKDIYPVGRLDKDSEGLLLLTNDKAINQQLMDPKSKVSKTYFVQVEGTPQGDAIGSLRKGVDIKVNKKLHHTLPAIIKLIDEPPFLEDRTPPIRERKNQSTRWVSITISEGKNRQVRKMFAKVGHPVLRLIRVRIGNIMLEGISQGRQKMLKKEELLS